MLVKIIIKYKVNIEGGYFMYGLGWGLGGGVSRWAILVVLNKDKGCIT